MHLVLQDELLRLGHVDVGLALIVLDDELHLHAAEHALVLVQIELEAVEHVGADGGVEAGARRQEADAQFLLGRRLRGAEDHSAAEEQRQYGSR